MTTKPRPHPSGGWFCEFGSSRPENACDAKATWVIATYAHSPGEYPGAVVCDEHLNFPDGEPAEHHVRLEGP